MTTVFLGKINPNIGIDSVSQLVVAIKDLSIQTEVNFKKHQTNGMRMQ